MTIMVRAWFRGCGLTVFPRPVDSTALTVAVRGLVSRLWFVGFPLVWGGVWFDGCGVGLVSRFLFDGPPLAWGPSVLTVAVSVCWFLVSSGAGLVSRLWFDGPPLAWGTVRFDGSGGGLFYRLWFVGFSHRLGRRLV